MISGVRASRSSAPCVLVVDDEPEIRAFIVACLRDEGYRAVEAGNGLQALSAVRDTPPDVIILDLFMPVMDGPTFIRRYRELPGPHAPILAVSASSKYLGLSCPTEADDYLDKPFDLITLLDRVQHHLARALA